MPWQGFELKRPTYRINSLMNAVLFSIWQTYFVISSPVVTPPLQIPNGVGHNSIQQRSHWRIKHLSEFTLIWRNSLMFTHIHFWCHKPQVASATLSKCNSRKLFPCWWTGVRNATVYSQTHKHKQTLVQTLTLPRFHSICGTHKVVIIRTLNYCKKRSY